MKKDQIKAFAPATVANVGCAFDIMGFAVTGLGDTVKICRSDSPTKIICSDKSLSTSLNKNTAGVAFELLREKFKFTDNVEIFLTKGLPIGSGLGSSAASAVAALVATNDFFELGLTKKELVPFAVECERVACGSAHPDNVVPSLFGGCVIVRTGEDIIQLPPITGVKILLLTPQIEVRTADARRILGHSVLLNQVVKQLGNVAALTAGFYTNDLELVSRAIDDYLIEPQRSLLIPGYNELKTNFKGLGALTFNISGSGPTIFSLIRDGADIESFRKIGIELLSKYGVGVNFHLADFDTQGGRVIE